MIPSGASGLFDITTAESGLKQAVMKFATFDPDGFSPARGDKCPNFIPGNDETEAILALLGYLACQTSVTRVNGEGNGIHGVDVTVQGAIFNASFEHAEVLSVAIAEPGLYTAIPDVVFYSGGEVTPAAATALMRVGTIVIVDDGASYDVDDILTVVGGTTDRPAQFRVHSVDGGGAIVSVRIVDSGLYSALPSNPVSFTTDGGGTGATATLAWKLAHIVVSDGGDYTGTPFAAVTGGTFTDEGLLGEVRMSARGLETGGDFTRPFDPVTTVKDTVDVGIYHPVNPPNPDPGPDPRVTVAARVVAAALGAGLYSTGDGPLPAIDGVTLNANANTGDIILLNDGTKYGGLWRYAFAGGAGFPWVLKRVPNIPYSTNLLIAIAEGGSAGLWHCTQGGIFDPDTGQPYHFEPGDGTVDPSTLPPTPVATYNIGLKATIDYHAIELTFEYVAKDFASAPRFLQNEYFIDAYGAITIDPVSGKKMTLEVDSVSAITQLEEIDSSGNATLKDGPPADIDLATWLAAVRFIGTAAQFEQTPAGAGWHVSENTTIKIMPKNIAGTIVPVPTPVES